jgi:hypothetical protein
MGSLPSGEPFGSPVSAHLDEHRDRVIAWYMSGHGAPCSVNPRGRMRTAQRTVTSPWLLPAGAEGDGPAFSQLDSRAILGWSQRCAVAHRCGMDS